MSVIRTTRTGNVSGAIRGWSTTGTKPRPATRTAWPFWVALVVALMLWAATGFAQQVGPDVRPFMGYTHISDITRGPPLGPPVNGCEPTTDWLGLGVTFAWRHVQIDLAHGVKQRDAWCGRPYAQPRENGTEVAIRWYPFRAPWFYRP